MANEQLPEIAVFLLNPVERRLNGQRRRARELIPDGIGHRRGSVGEDLAVVERFDEASHRLEVGCRLAHAFVDVAVDGLANGLRIEDVREVVRSAPAHGPHQLPPGRRRPSDLSKLPRMAPPLRREANPSQKPAKARRYSPVRTPDKTVS